MGLHGNGLVYSIDLFDDCGTRYHDCENSIEVSRVEELGVVGNERKIMANTISLTKVKLVNFNICIIISYFH